MLLAVVGMTIRQLPDFAFRSAGDYAQQMGLLRDRYEPVFGQGVVDVMERLQLFHVFSSTWFSLGLAVLIISIVVCTLDRTPRLWRQVADVRVVQPEPFFDPVRPGRAQIAGVASDRLAEVLRRHRFRVREAQVDGVRYVYGDRNQYTKMATLLTHAGLVLFLVAAAVTSQFGDEQGLVVAEGDTLTIQPIGTPNLLLVKNLAFEAPGFLTGTPTDFTTDLAVYRNGEEVARKTIRVNDPLAIDGYTIHQNGFGPAPNLLVRDAEGGILWSGPVPLTDQAGNLPYGSFAVPGRDVGIELLLERRSDGTGVLLAVPYRVTGTGPDGEPAVAYLTPMAITRGETATVPGIDFSVELAGFADYTLLIAKKDPGAPLVWIAFGLLLVGLVITFYLPRRRVWARQAPGTDLALVGRSDRYVDFDREFGRLLDDLVAARSPA